MITTTSHFLPHRHSMLLLQSIDPFDTYRHIQNKSHIVRIHHKCIHLYLPKSSYCLGLYQYIWVSNLCLLLDVSFSLLSPEHSSKRGSHSRIEFHFSTFKSYSAKGIFTSSSLAFHSYHIGPRITLYHYTCLGCPSSVNGLSVEFRYSASFSYKRMQISVHFLSRLSFTNL